MQEPHQRRTLRLSRLRTRHAIAWGERLNLPHDTRFGLVRDTLVGGALDRKHNQCSVARGARPLGPHELRAARTPLKLLTNESVRAQKKRPLGAVFVYLPRLNCKRRRSVTEIASPLRL